MINRLHLWSETKMRSSDFLWNGTDDCRDGDDSRSQESLMAVFTRSPIFSDHLERISDVQKECVTDQRTDRPTDGRADKASNRDARTHLNIISSCSRETAAEFTIDGWTRLIWQQDSKASIHGATDINNTQNNHNIINQYFK